MVDNLETPLRLVSSRRFLEYLAEDHEFVRRNNLILDRLELVLGILLVLRCIQQPWNSNGLVITLKLLFATNGKMLGKFLARDLPDLWLFINFFNFQFHR